MKARPTRASRTGRPIMVLLDLLGRRWTLRVLWELRDGPLSSRAIRAACGDISPTVLQSRVAELRDAGLVSVDRSQGYALTSAGRELLVVLAPLREFAEAHVTSDEAPPETD